MKVLYSITFSCGTDFSRFDCLSLFLLLHFVPCLLDLSNLSGVCYDSGEHTLDLMFIILLFIPCFCLVVWIYCSALYSSRLSDNLCLDYLLVLLLLVAIEIFCIVLCHRMRPAFYFPDWYYLGISLVFVIKFMHIFTETIQFASRQPFEFFPFTFMALLVICTLKGPDFVAVYLFT